MTGNELPIKEIVDLAKDRAFIYGLWQFFWFSVHYGAGLLAITAGGFATAAVAKDGPSFIARYVWLWGLVASLLSGVVTFLGPLQKAQSYKYAAYSLESHTVYYESKIIGIKDLQDTIEKTQQIVLTGYFETPHEPVNNK